MSNTSYNPDNKPLGQALGWQRLSTTRPYQSHWHNLRRDQVRLPDGQEITYTYQEHPGFVIVVPVTRDGQIVLIRSYRYTVDDWCWELPAGGLGDKAGVTPEAVARQELMEETGAQCLEMRQIGWFYVANGTTSARCTVFLATGVEITSRPELEATEQCEVHLAPIAKALQMARDGRITDGDSALALLRCEAQLAERGRRVEVAPYDPAWPGLFQAEAARLAAVFGEELRAIHHMGSTSVPGLAAKPIVDILPEVHDIQRIDDLNEAMIALGYAPKGENGIPGRRFFSKTVDGVRRFHVHVFQAGDPEIERHLAFVQYLRAHPDQAAAYGRLKQALAERFSADIDGYADGKNDFVQEMERKALAWREAVEYRGLP